MFGRSKRRIKQLEQALEWAAGIQDQSSLFTSKYCSDCMCARYRARTVAGGMRRVAADTTGEYVLPSADDVEKSARDSAREAMDRREASRHSH